MSQSRSSSEMIEHIAKETRVRADAIIALNLPDSKLSEYYNSLVTAEPSQLKAQSLSSKFARVAGVFGAGYFALGAIQISSQVMSTPAFVTSILVCAAGVLGGGVGWGLNSANVIIFKNAARSIAASLRNEIKTRMGDDGIERSFVTFAAANNAAPANSQPN